MDLTHFFFKSLVSLLSPPGPRGRLLVVIYHRVMAEPDPMRPNEVDAKAFQWQAKLLADHFHVLPLSEAYRRLREGGLPPRAACITFDDGYADNLDVAAPILKSYGLSATFFIATGFLGGGRMWNDTILELARGVGGPEWDLSELGLGRWAIGSISDRYRAAMALIYRLRHLAFDERRARVDALVSRGECTLPQDLMLTEQGVQGLLNAGMEVGAHTVNHPILTRLDDDRARLEICQSKDILEAVTGRPVNLFAYPNGKPGQDYDERHVEMVKAAGFEAAVSTRWAVARKDSDLLQLPRFTPWQRSPLRFHQALVRSYFW